MLLSNENLETLATLTTYQRKRKLKTKRITSRVNKLAEKELRGQHARLHVEIVPIIVGATGAIYNGFDKDIKKLNLERVKFDKFQTQKIALLGTAHIIRGFLQIA